MLYLELSRKLTCFLGAISLMDSHCIIFQHDVLQKGFSQRFSLRNIFHLRRCLHRTSRRLGLGSTRLSCAEGWGQGEAAAAVSCGGERRPARNSQLGMAGASFVVGNIFHIQSSK